ncbi:MAG: hypothetical protein AAF358_13490 [Pseudomonadota bacterium]
MNEETETLHIQEGEVYTLRPGFEGNYSRPPGTVQVTNARENALKEIRYVECKALHGLQTWIIAIDAFVEQFQQGYGEDDAVAPEIPSAPAGGEGDNSTAPPEVGAGSKDPGPDESNKPNMDPSASAAPPEVGAGSAKDGPSGDGDSGGGSDE